MKLTTHQERYGDPNLITALEKLQSAVQLYADVVREKYGY